jgi:hypothetical protein
MRTVDFFQLSRAAQDHFVDATTGTQPPAPVLVRRGGPTAHRVGWLVAVAAAIALFVFFQRGYGDVGSGAVVHGVALIAVWVALIALIVGGILHALAGEREIGKLPWKAGIYAFPTTVVDARTHRLVIHEGDDLERIEGSGGSVRLVFKGGTFNFSSNEAGAAEARAAIEQARNEGPASNEKVRASRDPLAEPRMSSPLAPTEARKRAFVSWARLRFVLAAAVALVIGPAIFYARNRTSDDRAFTHVKSRDDVSVYKAYLVRGVRHRDEVQKVLLPRAELRLAQKDGSVDAILAYQKAHPSSAIQKEVDTSLRTAMLAELEAAKKAGTLAALVEFEKKRPEHGLTAELKAARHTVYQEALNAFKANANDKDPTVAQFFERLIAYAEAHSDPKVEMRFRQTPSKELGRADKYVTKQPLFNGETSYPSRYFDQGKLAAHETELGKAIADKFAASFPKEVLSFSIGAPIPDGDALPAATVPTIFIMHRPDWTGTAYPSQRPRGIYIGVNYFFDSTFTIPADQKPLKLHAVIGKSVPLNVLKEFGKTVPVPGEPEKAVYNAMSKEGFEGFAQKFVASIYKTPNSGKK